MIRVDFDPTRLEGEQRAWWLKWEARAEEATRELVASGVLDGAPKFKEKLWAELKKWLFVNVFAGKCAYCEGKVTPQSFGDAEHWRPKGAVGRLRTNGRIDPVERNGTPHPGYWWLAYEWTNLLPACQRCNSGDGKGIQFPIGGDYVFEPNGDSIEELDRHERPLLLHPFRGEDPAEHIEFDEFGIPYPIDGSALGESSIRAFDLDRGVLNEERLEHLEGCEERFRLALITVATEGRSFEEAAGHIFAPSTKYSGAMRSLAKRWRGKIRNLI
jgi:hypothetical protein